MFAEIECELRGDKGQAEKGTEGEGDSKVGKEQTSERGWGMGMSWFGEA